MASKEGNSYSEKHSTNDTKWHTEKNGTEEVCRNFLNNRCLRGALCKFKHPEPGSPKQMERTRSRSPIPKGNSDSNATTCRDFLRNMCTRGKDCRFYHPSEEEVEKKSWFTLCLDFQNGSCTRHDCRYFHLSPEDEEMFRESGEVSLHLIDQAIQKAPNLDVAIKSSRPTCKDFLKGYCKFKQCRFRHVTRREYENEVYKALKDELYELIGSEELSAAGRPPIDEPTIDRPPTDRPPVDRPPIDRPPTDRPPVDRPPIDRPPIDRPPADRLPTPLDRPPVGRPSMGEVLMPRSPGRSSSNPPVDPSFGGPTNRDRPPMKERSDHEIGPRMRMSEARPQFHRESRPGPAGGQFDSHRREFGRPQDSYRYAGMRGRPEETLGRRPTSFRGGSGGGLLPTTTTFSTGSFSDFRPPSSDSLAKLQMENVRLRQRIDDMMREFNSAKRVESPYLDSKGQLLDVQKENQDYLDKIRALNEKINILKGDVQSWERFESYVMEQAHRLQNHLTVVENELSQSWGGGPPPMSSQREAWSHLRSIIMQILKPTIENGPPKYNETPANNFNSGGEPFPPGGGNPPRDPNSPFRQQTPGMYSNVN